MSITTPTSTSPAPVPNPDYILVMRDENYWLIGPFGPGEAQIWAAKYWNRAKGDPRWQVLSLSPERLRAGPRLHYPDQAENRI